MAVAMARRVGRETAAAVSPESLRSHAPASPEVPRSGVPPERSEAQRSRRSARRSPRTSRGATSRDTSSTPSGPRCSVVARVDYEIKQAHKSNRQLPQRTASPLPHIFVSARGARLRPPPRDAPQLLQHLPQRLPELHAGGHVLRTSGLDRYDPDGAERATPTGRTRSRAARSTSRAAHFFSDFRTTGTATTSRRWGGPHRPPPAIAYNAP